MNQLVLGHHRERPEASPSTFSSSPPTTSIDLHEDSFATLDQDEMNDNNHYGNGTEYIHQNNNNNIIHNSHDNNGYNETEMMDQFSSTTTANLNLQHRKGYSTQEDDEATKELHILQMNEGSTISLNDDKTPTPLTSTASLSHIPSTAHLLPNKQNNVGGKLYNSARTLLQKKYSAALEKQQLSTKKHTHYIYTYLTLLGFLGGLITFSHDIIVRYLVLGKNSLINLWDPEKDYSLRLFIWVVYNLIFVSFAIVLTALIAPAAEGSGLAGIKAILNGVRGLKDVLSLKTMIVKLLCLPAVLTAGLYIGKMGPSMHIVTCLANNLLKLKIFESIRKTKTLKQEMIVCGLVVGCAANDGAIIGGVLFGAELVGTYYSLRNYFKSFYAAFIACMTSRLLHSLVNQNIKPFFTWNIKLVPPAYTLPELAFMIVLAVVMAFVGAAVVYGNEMLLVLRDKYGKKHLGFFDFSKYSKSKLLILLENRIIYTWLICLITSIFMFPQFIGKFMSMGGVPVFEELLMTKPLTTVNGAKGEWTQGNLSETFITISIFLTIRYIITMLTIVVPVAGGSYLQLLVIGASLGRLVGEGLANIFPDGFAPNHPIIPASYGLVAAASLTSSQTQAFSSVFILLELTGNGVHLPSLVASYIGVAISRWLSYSAYDVVIKYKKWPAVLESFTDSDDIKVKYIMQYVDSISIIEEVSSIQKIDQILKTPNLPKTIPVVNNLDDLLLVGCVNTKKLQDYYESRLKPLVEKDPHCDELVQIEKDTCPVTISIDTPIVLAHLIFSKLGFDDVFVVWRGRLTGQVQKSSIIAELTEKQTGSIDA
ncbi:hypothetical protein C9374_003443 [Naegleria lovaniensis]|uniref:Chloride channel protein n=1 Tax=Naegleria lovaniensis TaxID=51637 RepID=A0AA88KKC8_NAELO|nr:uncharacterized protein C9374_003443 [Naegleria lovaniensis]KAG2385628.1 hypothetical protein C9374_003443 [Naegleria lovaniensis]